MTQETKIRDAFELYQQTVDDVVDFRDLHKGYVAGYQAAATLRDELIGKLVDALEEIGRGTYVKEGAVGVYVQMIDYDGIRGCAIKALAEAKAQGYGE